MSDFTEAPEAPHCRATTVKGVPCRAYARPGTTSCFEHDASVADARKAGKSRGGRAAGYAKGGEVQKELAQQVASASTPNELAAVMVKVAAMVLAGTLPPRTGAVLSQLGNTALSALKADLNERLERLQAVIDRTPELRAAWKRR